ncbi:hypothetical protein CTAYLR_007588 [Chrysophaeum taylorii]|uniref:EamA domain-containing protein n=1 Tax=Chrysophaeum taylorii TaxID=2483200 RepID=A0AAD7UAN9_9STRA|nr:hypothetical protein CTAYLR_007588 [Chrysophaeum taylorii]
MHDDAAATTSSLSARKAEKIEQERRGIWMCVGAVACVSTDAAILRWAQIASGATVSTVLVWRLLFVGCFVLAYAKRTEPGASGRCRQSPKLATAIAVSRTIPDIFLAAAFMLSLAANVSFCFAMNPLWAALGGWLILGDTLHRRTVAALLVSVSALSLVLAPVGRSGGTLIGDLFGVAAGFTQATTLLLGRAAALRAPALPLVFLSSTGAFVGAAGCALALLAASLPFLPDRRRGLFCSLMVLNSFVVSLPYVAFAVAVRLVDAATIALVAIVVNSALAPVWVYVAFEERPHYSVFVGGAVLVLVLALHEYLALRDARYHRTLGDHYTSGVPPPTRAIDHNDTDERPLDSSSSSPYLEKKGF